MSKLNERKLTPPSFTALVQSFFAEHLTQQRGLSAQTVAAYRPESSPVLLCVDDVLDAGDVVPGFTCPIRRIFG